MIPYELINLIVSYLDNNASSSMFLSSKYINTTLKDYGFMKELYVNKNFVDNDDMFVFFKRFRAHINTVRFLSLSFITDPHYWIPKWCKTMYFRRCNFTSVIDPRNIVPTEHLTIESTYSKIIINLKKFPELRTLHVVAFDFNDLDTIKECKKLAHISIITSVQFT